MGHPVMGSALRSFFFRYACGLIQVKRGAAGATGIFCFCFSICYRTCIFSRLSNVRLDGGRAFRLVNVHHGDFYKRQPRDSEAGRACFSALFAYRLRYFLSSAYRETGYCGRMFHVFAICFFGTRFIFFSCTMFYLRTSIILFRFFKTRFRQDSGVKFAIFYFANDNP